MPFISFTTNRKLTLQQEKKIKDEVGKLISILPNKSEEKLMIHLEDNQIMYFKGQETKCMMIAVHLYKETDLDAKKRFTEELTKAIAEITDIPVESQYVSYSEYQNWGASGKLI